MGPMGIQVHQEVASVVGGDSLNARGGDVLSRSILHCDSGSLTLSVIL